MSYDLEQHESDRMEMQEFNFPHPVGDITTEEDILELRKQKYKYKEEDWREDEWAELNMLQENAVKQKGG